MSVTKCLRINERLRAAGITVHEASGWKTRGNGHTSAYVGGLVHHTGSGFGVALPGTGIGNLLINGRSDLKGPLCNYAGNEDGTLTIIAANPANHAGASGGKSMGPLPVAGLFNPRVLGLEIVYPGTVSMRPAQYRTATVWARVVADEVGSGDIERIRAHAETSVTGKWDPGYAPGKTIDMRAFRLVAQTVLQGDVMNEYQQRVLVETQRRVSLALAVVTENQARITAGNAAIAALAELIGKGTNDLTSQEVGDIVEARMAKALQENTVKVDIDIAGRDETGDPL